MPRTLQRRLGGLTLSLTLILTLTLTLTLMACSVADSVGSQGGEARAAEKTRAGRLEQAKSRETASYLRLQLGLLLLGLVHNRLSPELQPRLKSGLGAWIAYQS